MNPTTVERRGEMHGAIEPAEAKIIRRVTRSEDPLRDELLRGIPNEVTLEHIATLLPRRAYEEVANVNPDWQRVLQGRKVYDAQARTQTFFVVSCDVLTEIHYVSTFKIEFKRTLSLFSPSEERWYNFPPIPGCHEGMLHMRSTVLFDGSIYLLGGTRGRKDIDMLLPTAEVLVMNLAGHPLEWRRCANMQAPRHHPQIRVMHGKIFVFGGRAESGGVEVQNEVYDPKVDTWSFIAPTMPSAFVSDVFSVGQQYFAFIGLMATPRDQSHVIDREAELYLDTKIVVTVGDEGPKLISTRDHDAEDDMDGLHKIIENQLVDHGKGVGRRQGSRAKNLASTIESEIRRIEQFDRKFGTTSFFGLYDPVKDEWRDLQMESLRESLGTDNVDNTDNDGPGDIFLDLMPRREFTWPLRHEEATAWLRSIKL